MTTLPTTTPIRLPRPVGATPLAMPMGPAQPMAGSTMSGADAWRVIRTNAWWVLLVTVACAAAGWGLNWYLLRNHSSFTAVGFTQVNPREAPSLFNQALVSTDIGALSIDQKTQAALLKQEALFIQVLQNPN